MLREQDRKLFRGKVWALDQFYLSMRLESRDPGSHPFSWELVLGQYIDAYVLINVIAFSVLFCYYTKCQYTKLKQETGSSYRKLITACHANALSQLSGAIFHSDSGLNRLGSTCIAMGIVIQTWCIVPALVRIMSQEICLQVGKQHKTKGYRLRLGKETKRKSYLKTWTAMHRQWITWSPSG